MIGPNAALFFALIWSGWHPKQVVLAPQSDGFGDCPAFQHSHVSQPGECFDDKWDRLVLSPGAPFA